MKVNFLGGLTPLARSWKLKVRLKSFGNKNSYNYGATDRILASCENSSSAAEKRYETCADISSDVKRFSYMLE